MSKHPGRPSIRDDQGFWNQIEKYIRDPSNVDFSHGICPACAERLYPDFTGTEPTRIGIVAHAVPDGGAVGGDQ